MKQVLFDLELIDRHYCFYLDTENNKLNAFAVRKNQDFYFVNRTNEIQFLNRIIEQINNRYVRVKTVLYNNEYYQRYINRFSKLSYFSKVIDGKELVCNYESIKPLYDRFNTVGPMFIGRKNKNNHDVSSNNSYDFEQYGSPFGTFNYTENSYGPIESFGYTEYQSYNYQMQQDRQKNKRNAPFGKILIAVAGAVGIISISALGLHILKTEKFPFVSSKEEQKTEQMADQETSENIEIMLEEKEPSLETEFGDVDTKADTEEQKVLKEKYYKIEEQLKNAGLKPWEISAELDTFSVFHGESEKISFYYDSKKNEVIYVFEPLVREKEDVKTPEAGEEKIPECVEKIMNAVSLNENLTTDEKSYILGTYLDMWVKDSKFIENYADEIAERFSKLKFEYDKRADNGADYEITDDYPYSKVSGVYQYTKGYVLEERRVRNNR